MLGRTGSEAAGSLRRRRRSRSRRLLAACGRPTASGWATQAYGEGRYAEALAEYRVLAEGKPRTRGSGPRPGAAALHAGELRESAGRLPPPGGRRSRPGPRRRPKGWKAWPARPSGPGNADVLQRGGDGSAGDRARRGPPAALRRWSWPRVPTPSTAELVALAAAAPSPRPATRRRSIRCSRCYARALRRRPAAARRCCSYRAVLRRSQDSAMRAPARQRRCRVRLHARQRAPTRRAGSRMPRSGSPRPRGSIRSRRSGAARWSRYAEARLGQGDTLAAVLALPGRVRRQHGRLDGSQAAAGRLGRLGIHCRRSGDTAGSGVR